MCWVLPMIGFFSTPVLQIGHASVGAAAMDGTALQKRTTFVGRGAMRT